MRKIYRFFAGILCLFILSILSVTLYTQAVMPDFFYVASGEELYINSNLSIAGAKASGNIKPVAADNYDHYGNQYNVDIKLFEAVPVKRVQVQVVDRKMVVPGGSAFGIKMHTQGVIIVGLSDIQNGAQSVNPAKDSGLKVGDIITHIDDIEITKNKDVGNYIADCEGTEMKITVIRDSMSMDFYLSPVHSEFEDCYKAGIWVRDSSAGIGTLTYYDPETLGFAGLGHAICDIDTGKIMPLYSGEIVDVNISGVHAGLSGKPGELKGAFASETPIGYLYENSNCGIFGVLADPIMDMEPVPMALKQEILPGPAQIYSTISGNKPRSFDIVIEKVNYSDSTPTKNMVVKIVDEELLSKTGGIVQGMSGSPIIQDGRLVGAVTHVFVNDPTRGYGIFVENMDKMLDSIENLDISA